MTAADALDTAARRTLRTLNPAAVDLNRHTPEAIAATVRGVELAVKHYQDRLESTDIKPGHKDHLAREYLAMVPKVLACLHVLNGGKPTAPGGRALGGPDDGDEAAADPAADRLLRSSETVLEGDVEGDGVPWPPGAAGA